MTLTFLIRLCNYVNGQIIMSQAVLVFSSEFSSVMVMHVRHNTQTIVFSFMLWFIVTFDYLVSETFYIIDCFRQTEPTQL